jgi:AraC-like DNA-binding protein
MPPRQQLPNDKIHAPFKLAALVDTLREQGIPAQECLRGVGVEPHQLGDATVRTSVRQYAHACMNALRLGPNARTPFQVGSRLHLLAYGMYGYALMSCLSLRDYFNLGVKYHLLATPILTINWHEYQDSAVWSFPDEFTFAPSNELRQFLLEQQFTQHVTHLQDVAGRDIRPMKAHFSYRTPAHAAIYEDYLGCPCEFGRERCELHYESSILDQRPPLAHHLTSAMFRETCEYLIKKAKSSSGVSGETYQLLIRKPGHFPGMEDVAQALHMTSRTLRRRLDGEGLSFSEILDDVHRSISIEYLKTTSMSVDDIGILVGFNDVANFRKAFKRWTGKTPSEMRREAR